MSKTHPTARLYGRWIALCAATAFVPWSLVHAGRAIEERRPADPQGEVEIVNVSGNVEVTGWDRSEVEVSGSAGENVDRVDVVSGGNHTSIRHRLHDQPAECHGLGEPDFDGELHVHDLE